jgi:tRNA (guanine37-N1)-methyltransferase
MKITILTLFPEMFTGVFDYSMIGRAVKNNLIDIQFINIRDFATDAYKTVDDHPYGGGVGMIMKVDVADRAITHAKSLYPDLSSRVILLDPQGAQYKQAEAKALSTYDHLIFFCPRYEGIDERIRTLVDAEFSIGDYILTGGEIPAMVIVDSVVRLIPGVLGKKESPIEESFSNPNLLEGPQYTNPQTYKGTDVPAVLLSGDHKKIKEWKEKQATLITSSKRPDLLHN